MRFPALTAQRRITGAFAASRELVLTDASRVVIMSDCHRGHGDWADTFADNGNIFFAALEYYYRNKFTYIELGDGDELWENRRFADTVATYKELFCLMNRFYRENRLCLIYGNHDIEKRAPHFFSRHFTAFTDRAGNRAPLFQGLRVREGLTLRHAGSDNRIFLLHGHQADLMNGPLWRLSRFLVRYVWRLLETLGVNDPTSASKNRKRKNAVERRLTQWAVCNRCMVVAGHTHRPVFPEPGMPLYFNSGSCVARRAVTALEICAGAVRLVRWGYRTRPDGGLYVAREVLSGPRRLADLFRKAAQRQDPPDQGGYRERLSCPGS